MSEPEKLFLIDMDAVKIDGLTGKVTHYSAEEMRAAMSEQTEAEKIAYRELNDLLKTFQGWDVIQS